MRLSIYAVLLSLAVLGGAAADEPPAPDTYAPARPFGEAFAPLADAPAPATPLAGPEGPAPGLADRAGRPVISVFWATWCPVCRDEMPGVAALARRLARSGGAALVPVSIDTGDDAPARVARHLRAEGLETLQALVDPGHAAATALGLRAVPTAVFIDAAGRVRGRIEGRALWNEPALEAYVLGLSDPN